MMRRFLLMTILISTHCAVSADSFDGTMMAFEVNDRVAPYFKHSYAWAVFPSVAKGGFVIGGAYGKGRVYRKDEVMGTVSLTKLTVGFQVGGQVFSEIIFLEDERAYDEFTSGSYEFGATASAVAITAGAQLQAGTTGSSANVSVGPGTAAQADTGFRKGMAVFTLTLGGLMYEAAIGGQKFRFYAD